MRPEDQGFEEVWTHGGGVIGHTPDYWLNDYFDDHYLHNGAWEQVEGYCTDVWTDRAIEFLAAEPGRPAFVYLPLNAPHSPFEVPERFEAIYRDRENVPDAAFYGMITAIDEAVGRLEKWLVESGTREDTILVFLTDNGTSRGVVYPKGKGKVGFDAGMRGKKSSVYDGGHRVPFFIHWPTGGLNSGRDITTLAAHIDVLPTLADLCDIPVPDDYQPDGVSLKPLLYESNPSWARDHHVIQFHGGAGATTLPSRPFEYTVVLTERWRLVNSNGQSLYDIQADPAQRRDLSEKHPEVVAELRATYLPFWERVSPRLAPVRIDIGNPSENPTALCSQDWYMPNGNPPWNFGSIRRLPKVTGPWMLQVIKAGRYRITLRQFPEEADEPVVAARARIEIAGQVMDDPVEAGSKGVVFEIDLPAGPTRLMTYLYDKNGKAGGAYFTEVEAIESVAFPDNNSIDN